MTRTYRRIGWILSTAVVVGCNRSSSAKGPVAASASTRSTRPATTVASTRILSPEEAGRASAERDIAAGKLEHWLALPEAFWLESMRPGGDDAHLLDYYAAVLADRYGITFHYFLMVPGGAAPKRFPSVAYHQAMDEAIDAKFGKDVLDKAWKDACNLKDDDRAAYLKKRGRAAATRPATE